MSVEIRFRPGLSQKGKCPLTSDTFQPFLTAKAIKATTDICAECTNSNRCRPGITATKLIEVARLTVDRTNKVPLAACSLYTSSLKLHVSV